MKNSIALTVLSLTLASCSQGQMPSASVPPAVSLATAPTSPTQADYDALALSNISALSLTPQVHLNVFPVPGTPGTVRAYVKSSFASPATCDVSFGDGNAPVSAQSPTSTRIQTLDRAYATYGSYTVTVTCRNGGTVVGTRSVTLKAGPQPTGTVLTFENPALPDDSAGGSDFNASASYQEGGFNFTNPLNHYFHQLAKHYEAANMWLVGDSQTLLTYSMGDSVSLTTNDGAPFTLSSLETSDFFRGSAQHFNITGHKADGTTVTLPVNDDPNALITVNFDSTWKGLTSVSFGDAGYIILENIHVSR